MDREKAEAAVADSVICPLGLFDLLLDDEHVDAGDDAAEDEDDDRGKHGVRLRTGGPDEKTKRKIGHHTFPIGPKVLEVPLTSLNRVSRHFC